MIGRDGLVVPGLNVRIAVGGPASAGPTRGESIRLTALEAEERRWAGVEGLLEQMGKALTVVRTMVPEDLTRLRELLTAPGLAELSRAVPDVDRARTQLVDIVDFLLVGPAEEVEG